MLPSAGTSAAPRWGLWSWSWGGRRQLWPWAALWLVGWLLAGALAAGWGKGWGLDAAAIDRSCLRGCAPGAVHWLGTDTLGRDVLAQLVHGARTALWGGLTAAVLAGVLGFGLGASAAWTTRAGGRLPYVILATAALGALGVWYCLAYLLEPGGWIIGIVLVSIVLVALLMRLGSKWKLGVRADQLLLYVVEVAASLPALLLLLAVTALALRPGLLQLVLIYVGLVTTRLAALSLQEVRRQLQRPYVMAAHHAGLSAWRLLSGHVLPNVLPPYGVELVLTVAGFILLEGTFSFLGLGLPPTTASWGHLLAETRAARGAWWLWLFPGATLTLTVLALQVLGRALRSRRAGVRAGGV